jgi:hypothetical protein
VRRAELLVAVLAFATVAAVAVWGCATTTAEGAQLDRPRESEPDGGWAAYRPSRGAYDVDPGRLAAGAPPTSPAFSLDHDSH